jgi:hypothetical protein
VRLKDRIQSPRDPDIATSLGSAQYGLARSLVHRPLGGPTVVASKSYVLGIGADLADHGAEGLSDHTERDIPPNGQKKVFKYVCMFPCANRTRAPDRWLIECPRTHYLVVKGALLRKGVPVLEKMTKFSKDSSGKKTISSLSVPLPTPLNFLIT